MRLLTIVGFAALMLLSTASAAAADPTMDELTKQTPEQLMKGIENQHPVVYYLLAGKLYDADKKDEAVFWFYAGQLRFRFMLAAHPELDPTKDQAVFASMTQQIGTPINIWAFGDLLGLETTLLAVLDWDDKTPNGFTSKKEFATQWTETRDGMKSMVTYIGQNAEKIRAQRSSAGLENRK
ncbi:MAG: hypothetical protein WC538_12550 [Thermoanaerobaculia bacterium]|jgi:hypothetical protein